MSNEQWLSSGNCDICRRRKYCSKPCKPAQRRQAAQFAGAVTHAIVKAIAKTEGSQD